MKKEMKDDNYIINLPKMNDEIGKLTIREYLKKYLNIDSDIKLENLDTKGKYLTIREFLKKDFDTLATKKHITYRYVLTYSFLYGSNKGRQFIIDYLYNTQIEEYNLYKKKLLTKLKNMLNMSENEILDNVYVDYIPEKNYESFVEPGEAMRDRSGYLILKTKDGKSAILNVINNPYINIPERTMFWENLNYEPKKPKFELKLKVILEFKKYELRPYRPGKRFPGVAHNLETNLEGTINYETCQIENEKFDKIYFKKSQLFPGYGLYVGERNGKLGTVDGFVPTLFDDIDRVAEIDGEVIENYSNTTTRITELSPDAQFVDDYNDFCMIKREVEPNYNLCYITTLNGKQGAYFIGKRGHIRQILRGFEDYSFTQTSFKKIIIPPYFDKVTLLDCSDIIYSNLDIGEFISNPVFKVALNGKEGIYLGGEKKFIAPPIFDIDGICDYDIDKKIVSGYINGVFHIYKWSNLERVELETMYQNTQEHDKILNLLVNNDLSDVYKKYNLKKLNIEKVDVNIPSDTKETLTLFLNKVRRRKK